MYGKEGGVHGIYVFNNKKQIKIFALKGLISEVLLKFVILCSTLRKKAYGGMLI